MLRKLTLTVCTLLALVGLTGTTAQATTNYQASAQRAVCHYFTGSLCTTAMQIVKCETGGTYEPWAANGQYHGIWQMGSSERAKYGDGNNVWAQTKAAYAYYLAEKASGDSYGGFGPWLRYEPSGCGG